MKNITMEQQDLSKENKKENKKVDENGGILIDEHIKIFDPNSNKVILNKRE